MEGIISSLVRFEIRHFKKKMRFSLLFFGIPNLSGIFAMFSRQENMTYKINCVDFLYPFDCLYSQG